MFCSICGSNKHMHTFCSFGKEGALKSKPEIDKEETAKYKRNHPQKRKKKVSRGKF